MTPSLDRRRLLAAGSATAAATAAASMTTRSAAADPLPRTAAASRPIDLVDRWLFGGAYIAGSDARDYDDSRFEEVTLPHCVTRMSWWHWDPAAWQREWIYRRHFDYPAVGDGRRLFVDFQGAMVTASVTLNDHELGQHRGGYLPFSFEITDHVERRDNVLAVRLDSRWQDVPPQGDPGGAASIDYLEPGGLYRDVTLRAVPQVFLRDLYVRPDDVLTDPRLKIKCEIDAGEVPAGSLRLRVELRQGSRVVTSRRSPVAVDTGRSTITRVTLSDLGDIDLWHVDHPHLYTVVAILELDGHPIHTLRHRVGFREARFTSDGFFLNGKRLKIFGLNRHQLYPYVGMAMPARVQRRDAEILRNELNCNMVRCAHYPQSPDFLDACDELGIMVWEEPPGWQYLGDDAWRQLVVDDVGAMVLRDRSRPSVVIWGVRVNESANDPVTYRQTRKVADDLDGTRPTAGSMIIYATADWEQDIFSYDDYSDWDKNAFFRPVLPGTVDQGNLPYLLSEAVGASDGIGDFSRIASPANQQGQALQHSQALNMSAADDRYSGMIGWCGFDYQSLHGTPNGTHTSGVSDHFRLPKHGARVYLSQVDPRRRPVLEPAFYWGFADPLPLGGPGENALICSNCDRLEIYLDHEHHSTVRPASDRFPYLHYPPFLADLTVRPGQQPELRIDGFLGDDRVISRRFSPDPARDRLAADADDIELVADGRDATRVTFAVVDRFGAPRGFPTGRINLSLTGPGELIGDDPFVLDDTGGVGAVWIRTAARRPGVIKLTLKHPTLGQRRVVIRSVAAPDHVARFDVAEGKRS
ncbi:glycoside hydrolase family 2 protein [Microlunatus soli]|uniref:Beta-galactosidase n=1 Tax=Microlunatus soli TaxID=630515 RepID=A0A1H1QNB4_9ACTN|nr:glycoside hydrolase family 2 TIM barrel-domain containing protein [Microlunatus soli]SDS24419.1 beta-galactosidase [Microlunatus soli]